jgi:predicted RNA polymerase sigma factor
VYFLNRAIVVAQIEGPQAGIRALDETCRDPALGHFHLFDATLGEFCRRAGDMARAREHLEAPTVAFAPTDGIRRRTAVGATRHR